MDKFQDRFRIPSHRLKNWDYSKNGIYFITIVVQNREYILGYIENKKMELSDFGKIVNDEWFTSFEIRNELFLDEFVIMPNHLHALVVLKNPNNFFDSVGAVETHGRASNIDNEMVGGYTETHGRASLPPQQSSQPSKIIPHRKPKSISSFIAGFKSATTTQIDDYIDMHNLTISKYNMENKLWQANYHDHIVRNEEEYWKIKNYIRNNPANWVNDKFNEI